MARSNFSFKKRQKELERKKKQEEKRQRRQAKKENLEETPVDADGEGDLLAPQPETGEEPEAPTDKPLDP